MIQTKATVVVVRKPSHRDVNVGDVGVVQATRVDAGKPQYLVRFAPLGAWPDRHMEADEIEVRPAGRQSTRAAPLRRP